MHKFKLLQKIISVLLILILTTSLLVQPVIAQGPDDWDQPSAQESITQDEPSEGDPTTEETTTSEEVPSTPEPEETPGPSQTPDPNSTPEPDTGSIEATNSAQVTNNVDSTSTTGENNVHNSENRSSSDPSDSPSTEVKTGDSVAVTQVESKVNSNVIRSQIVYQTINIFSNQTGDLDLSNLNQMITQIAREKPNESEINIEIKGNQIAYVENKIVSSANTGENHTQGAQLATSTGDAYSVVSLLNQVNLTVIDSTLHLFTINIFGNLRGNIILPSPAPQPTNCDDCGVTLTASNSAQVTNNVYSHSITGQNNIDASGSGTLSTGDAQSLVTIQNLVNTNLIGVNLVDFTVNTFGVWLGQFLGWGEFAATDDQNLNLQSNSTAIGGTNCTDCVPSAVSSYNQALVENNIQSLANTGKNTASGNNVNLRTGNALSEVTIFNLVNSFVFRSNVVLGSINIFGIFEGDIGDTGHLPQVPKTEEEEEQEQSKQSQLEEGGTLEITQTNNVGEFVYPGDTVTFSISLKNTGSGTVYQPEIKLFLVDEGEEVGGTVFNLNDLKPGKEVKINTGFELARQTPATYYVAVAEASGYVGPDQSLISDSSESNFLVKSNDPFSPILAATKPGQPEASPDIESAVLGITESFPTEVMRDNSKIFPREAIALIILGFLFLGLRIMERKYLLPSLISQRSGSMKKKLMILRQLML